MNETGERIGWNDVPARGCDDSAVSLSRSQAVDAQAQSMAECSSVPYTYKSLALVWLIAFVLVALTASGVMGTPWLLAVMVGALAAPFMILRESRAAGVVMASQAPARAIAAGPRSVTSINRANEDGASPN